MPKKEYKPIRHEFDAEGGLQLKIEDLKTLQRLRFDDELSKDMKLKMLALVGMLDKNLNLTLSQINTHLINFNNGFKNPLSVYAMSHMSS